MNIEMTAFEMLVLPETDVRKQAFREQEAQLSSQWQVDYQSDKLKAMGGLGLFCARTEAELDEAA